MNTDNKATVEMSNDKNCNMDYRYNYEVLCGIYKITSPSGKIYIGVSPNIYKRWRGYRHERAKRQPKLHASFSKYSVDAHKFEIVELCEIKEIHEREIYYISYFNTFDTKIGLNLTKGGKGTNGCKLKPYQIFAIKKSNTGRVKPESEKISISQGLKKRYTEIQHHSKGKKQPQTLIDKRVAKNTGKKHSIETKILMSAKAIGNKRWLGSHHSEETKEKIRVALKGKERWPTSAKLILNTQTGIYYTGVSEAAKTINQTTNTLCRRLHGRMKNNTPFIYV